MAGPRYCFSVVIDNLKNADRVEPQAYTLIPPQPIKLPHLKIKKCKSTNYNAGIWIIIISPALCFLSYQNLLATCATKSIAVVGIRDWSNHIAFYILVMPPRWPVHGEANPDNYTARQILVVTSRTKTVRGRHQDISVLIAATSNVRGASS